MNRVLLALALTLVSLSLAGEARAQDDVAAAAQAFQEGQAAQLRQDYGPAGGFFELADRLAPSPAALRSAIRNHAAAGNRARAATLAADALSRYPADASVREVADDALAVAGELGTLEILCAAPCLATVGGTAIETEAQAERTIFVEPGTHVVEVSFDGEAAAEETAEVAAGAQVSISLVRPPVVVALPPEPEVETQPPVAPPREPVGEATTDAAGAESSGLLPMWVAFAGLGATAVVGAVALWSGIDTLSARDAYVEDPTEAGYEDGTGRQARTNALIGVTVGLGVATAALFVLANLGGDEEAPVTASVSAGREGAGVHLAGSF
ncbi:MAG: hypothetical protein JRH11_10145 [Deltaproteobacteria bacterium]|nr:hypothetical protein [Deltaproteobacteria bacterium]